MDTGTEVATAIAVDTDRNSQSAVKWAVENLLSGSNTLCFLVHIRTLQPQSYELEGLSKGALPANANELKRMFLPYRGFCARKGINANEVVLHDLNVSNALLDYIRNNGISNIIVGASNRSALTRKFRAPDVASMLVKSAPNFCSVYVISRGKVQTIRPASRTVAQILSGHALPQIQYDDSGAQSFGKSSLASWQSAGSDKSSKSIGSMPKASHNRPCPPASIKESLNSLLLKNSDSDSSSEASFSGPLSFRSSGTGSDFSYSSTSDNSRSSASSYAQDEIEAEMRRLKLELEQTKDMYNMACKEVATTKERERQLQQKVTSDTYIETEMEAVKGKHEREREKCTEAQKFVSYRPYSIEEIETATKNFSKCMKIGEGGYGPVYKGMLDHTRVAIKVLRPDASEGRQQFEQEVGVLSCMRHPNMVLLLGACPEYGCLIYEYMENGSLEDRLFRKHNTPSLPWQDRFRIAAEIATALLFLHQAKPEPLVHRDLKPGNILLDKNYVSKISDVGLARLVPPSVADNVTRYHMTAAAGTFCYIDPEYQQTGMLGVKCDVYSLGVMLLQIITALPPMGLALKIEEAIHGGTLCEILDQTVRDWPVKETLSFAELALKCCELRKKDRPDLGTVVLPELLRLKELGDHDAAFC